MNGLPFIRLVLYGGINPTILQFVSFYIDRGNLATISWWLQRSSILNGLIISRMTRFVPTLLTLQEVLN